MEGGTALQLYSRMTSSATHVHVSHQTFIIGLHEGPQVIEWDLCRLLMNFRIGRFTLSVC